MPIHPNARQCAYIMVNGIRCGGPAWEENPHCYHHFGLKSRATHPKMSIPPLDDQNAVQVAIMDALNGLLTGRLCRADAYTLLYGIQIARTNLRGLTLVPPPPDTIAEMLAAAKAEGRAEAHRDHKDEGTSIAEHLFRALGEEMDEAGQAHVNGILAKYGKPPISAQNPQFASSHPGPSDFDRTSTSPGLSSDSAFSPELLEATSWEKKKIG